MSLNSVKSAQLFESFVESARFDFGLRQLDDV